MRRLMIAWLVTLIAGDATAAIQQGNTASVSQSPSAEVGRLFDQAMASRDDSEAVLQGTRLWSLGLLVKRLCSLFDA